MIDIEKLKQAIDDNQAAGWPAMQIPVCHARELITRLKAAEQDANRWNWMLERMSGKDVMIFAQRPAWPVACCDDIVADMDKVMKESK